MDWPAGGRINPLPAQSGLARLDPLAVFDPVVAGSTRWRFDPVEAVTDDFAAEDYDTDDSFEN